MAKIDGQKYAVVPLDEYKAFLKASLNKSKHTRPRPTFIMQRPDVADFFREKFGTQSLVATVAECREKFGEENTPTMSAAHRHWQKLRKEKLVEIDVARTARRLTAAFYEGN